MAHATLRVTRAGFEFRRQPFEILLDREAVGTSAREQTA
jgi:hypothetical protein